MDTTIVQPRLKAYAPATPTDQHPGDKPTVLIVDDEPNLLELMNLQARTAADVDSARRLS